MWCIIPSEASYLDSETMENDAASIQLSSEEVRAVHLWRQMGFGNVTLLIQHGKPISFEAHLQGRFDKPPYGNSLELLTRSA